MSKTLITCPICKTQLPLTESLAPPLVESRRRQYEQKAEEVFELQSVLKERDTKLTDDQNTQPELIPKQRELDDAKRKELVRGVIESTAGMYGDLQGLAGRTLQEIEISTLPLWENGEPARSAEQ